LHEDATFITFIKNNVMPEIVIILIVGAVAGWLAGMIVDADGGGLLLDIVLGIVGGYVAVHYIFHGILNLTGYHYVDLTITATVGAAVLALIIKLIRRATR
jgi:uncharacterized membrane protein YeaQ/YmgE (transglycosylase-associated protein family)